jgi:exopolysaccharide biosynthesis polyprenyl glycosylphosphotransferase
MSPNRHFLLTAIKVFDLSIVTAGVIAAVAWTAGPSPESWAEVLSLRISVENFLFMLVYLAYWHFVLRGTGLYRSYRLSAAKRELRDLATATAVAVIPLPLVAPLFDFEYVTAPFLAVFALSTFVGLGVSRRALRAAGRRVRLYGRNLRNVVVIGVGDATLELSAQLARRNDFGYRVVGVIDCGTGGGGVDPGDALRLIGALVDNGQIDEVFMALPLDTSQDLIGRIIGICEEQGITVRLATQVASLYWARALIDEIEGQPIITVHTGPADSPGLFVKRAIDVVGAAVGLLFLAPVFLLCALAIKLDSRGPIFFYQERVGYSRRRFRVFKFRTMVAEAEALQASLEPRNEADGPVFKIAQDPRVTRVGYLLRRTSIDELPQLINVLRGEMSLVGPRPLPVRDVDRIDVRWHRRRFSVKPGITCLWQVESRQPRFDEWIKLDMQYIDNWSLALDLKILAKTIPAVLSGQGAQ